ncbi:hypothetical protein B0H13DRAFT_1901667 [Mycena leptocephala]|nr:hypothetical protein B0H13DRAFT_1901667 [Mycena leptocephala]
MESRQLSLFGPGPNIKRRLDALWVSHVRSLVQALHETAEDQEFHELEFNIQIQMRAIVRDILSNMDIILGATKIEKNGDKDGDSDPLSPYYVPGFATMTFAMTEHFASYSGFTGDEDPVFREHIFDVLSLL